MKNIYIVLMAGLCLLTAATQTAHAQGLSDNQRLLGYTVTDDIDINGAMFGEAGTYTIGAVLTPQLLSSYAGCRIVGLRIAAAVNLGRTRTFIYHVTGGGLSAVVEQNQRLYEGWNNIFFNGDGYEVSGDETLFFGFDYVETTDMVTTTETGGLCGVGEDIDGGFYLLQNDALYQITGAGRLCVQLIVDVSSLPLYDIDMTYFDSGFKYKTPGEDIEVLATCTNVGRAPLTSYRLGWQLDDQEPVYQNFVISQEAGDEETPSVLLKEGQSESWQFTVHLPADIAVGMHQLSVFACEAEGEALPEKSKNDRMTASFAIYEQSVRRNKVYLEVYSDQKSPYVPYLDEALKLVGANNAVAIVNVHRPGTPLAIDGAAYLHELYAYDWPTFTVNRAYFPGEEYVAYDMNYYLPVIGAEMTAGIINDMLIQDLYSPSFATIGLQAAYDETSRQLTVETSGTLLPEAESIYGDMAVTIMLVEDGVKSPQYQYNEKTGRTVNNQNYLHDYVLRDYMTAPIGDAIETDGTNWSLQRTATLDAAWKPGKVSVVALLTKRADMVTADNLLDMDVINCTSISLASTMGVSAMFMNHEKVNSEVYNLNGQRVAQPSKGLYIVNGKKRIVK